MSAPWRYRKPDGRPCRYGDEKGNADFTRIVKNKRAIMLKVHGMMLIHSRLQRIGPTDFELVDKYVPI